jgi:molybdate transport system substrate-binding protein
MPHARRLVSLLAAVALAWAALASAAEPAAAQRTLTVLAAASLTEAFRAIGSAFETAHPGVRVELGFGASSTLAAQIKEGAPADVFASADESNMKKVADAGELAGAARTFATNRLTIVVPNDDPGHVASLADLAGSDITVALAAPEVPAGKYAAEALAKAGIEVAAASQEVDVRAVLSKVALGEADAGIVYVTDLRAAAGKVKAVPIPEQYNVTARYPIAVLKGAADAATGTSFVDYVLSPEGQGKLREFGFLPPDLASKPDPVD